MIKVRNIVIGLIASALVVGVVVSCGGGGGGGGSPNPGSTNVVRSAALDGAQAGLPLVTGTGRGAVVVDPSTMEITGGISFTGLTGAPDHGAHIHDQAAGDAIIIGLVISPDNVTATVPAGTSLSSTQYGHLLAGQLYFQVHTTANPGGEIRGQITGTTGVTAAVTTLSQANETIKPVPSSGTGKGTLVVDSTTGAVITGVITWSGLTEQANAAHIHTAPPGTDGPVTLGFNVNGTIATAPNPSSVSLSDLAINYLYFQVHTPNNNPLGEIRGTIVPQ